VFNNFDATTNWDVDNELRLLGVRILDGDTIHYDLGTLLGWRVTWVIATKWREELA
jgi:hypothetical protein